jgi:hypothetical protein
MRKFTKIMIVGLALLMAQLTIIGQTSSGLTGTVTDQSGAIVPGVTVTLLDTKTTKEQTTITNDEGSYHFNTVEPGTGYRLTFTRSGFQTYVLNEVQVAVGRTDTQNAQLTPGEVSAKVEVVSTTADATLNTTDSSLGNVISSRQLKELPIQIRGTPAALLGLQPGVVGSNLGTTATNRVGSVTGSRADQGNITVDGIDANDQATGQAFNTVGNAPIDSIQEFRGTVAGFNASDGRSSGGQVQLRTNSGTNEYHGNIREYYRTEKTAANSFFNNKNKTLRPALRRHQYGGSIGGPLPLPKFGIHDDLWDSGKDKSFFFFDNERRRDRSQTSTSRVVPLASFRAGNVGYIRATNSSTGAVCTTAARQDNPATAGCVGFVNPAGVAALDPQHVGPNLNYLAFASSRFPLPNDLTGGDGLNTGLFRWNAPNVRDDRIYTLRFDVVPTDRQRIFFRTTITRRDSTNSIQFLPQDADAVLLADKSYGWVVGHTWIITPALTNSATAGVTKSQLYFSPPAAQPSFPFSYSGGTIGAPFASLSYQDREVATPTYRDDLTWTHGSHTFFGGFSFKPIRQLSHLTNDFNFVTIGLGGTTAALNASLRPVDILNNATARSRYDTAFTTVLGRFATISTNYNYNTTGTALAAGSGKVRNYAYNEYEGYVQDNWKIFRDLTLNLGVRYALYPAPYETNGLLANDSTDWKALFKTRVANAAAGISGNSAEPFLTYTLAGKTNNAPPLYKTDKNNWAPRVGFAYNPSASGGILGALLGDRKTVFRGGVDVTYDRVSGAVLFIQNQSDYLFANSAAKNFGNANANTALLNDPRFTTLNSPPPAVSTAPPVITNPTTPFVSGGVPFGLAGGQTNYDVDHNFKTPYSWLFNFGVQRELPGNHLLDVAYVGRLGRSLFVQSDAAQTLNFRDNASGQFLFPAFNNLQAQLQAGTAIAALTPIPWFENQMTAAIHANYGAAVGCGSFGLGANCTQLAATLAGSLIQVGDASDAIANFNANAILFNNVGISGQFGTNAFVTNQGTSDYHGLLLTLTKRFSKGFEYEVNYTFSKSLDNNSTVANTVFGGVVCDINDPDICRGPSDFDIRHIFNANFIMDLPFGRGKRFGGSMNPFVDAVFGGWTLSGIVSGRSGLAFSPAPSVGSFPISFVLSSPAVVTNPGAFGVNVHNVPTGAADNIQYYADPVAANAALRDPHNGEIGARNVLRGPRYWNFDMGLAKRFKAPWSEGQRFTLRVDAFNLTNSNMFATPNITRNSSSFGVISASANAPRELQFALRWDF